MAVLPIVSSSLQLTKQWHYICVLDLNVGNSPGVFCSGIKCLWFEKRLPWAKVFFLFFSHTHTFSTKTIYMNSRLHWTLLGVQGDPSLDCEDSSRLVNAPTSALEYCASEITAKWEIFKCHPYPKYSYLSSGNIYLKHFHFLGKQQCKYI